MASVGRHHRWLAKRIMATVRRRRHTTRSRAQQRESTLNSEADAGLCASDIVQQGGGYIEVLGPPGMQLCHDVGKRNRVHGPFLEVGPGGGRRLRKDADRSSDVGFVQSPQFESCQLRLVAQVKQERLSELRPKHICGLYARLGELVGVIGRIRMLNGDSNGGGHGRIIGRQRAG